MKGSSLALRGIAEGRVLTGPETLHVDITNGCNTNCITCWDHSPLLTIGRTSAWKRQRADADTILDVVDDAAGLGALRAIIVSGMGEPFTHPDVYYLLAGLKSRGLHVTVITNLVAADAERIIDLDVDALLVGIHAASETAYRAFHPSFQADEWTRLHAMLARFRAAGRRDKHVHVICAPNAHELVGMIELGAEQQAAQVNFKLASLKDGTEAARIDAGQRARLVEEWLPAAAARAAALGVTHNLDVLRAQLGAGGAATAPIAEVGCFMGHVYARITVDGTVLYCCNTEVVVGSLAGGATFSSLWHGEAWNTLRARLRAGDYLPSCAQCGKLNQNVKIGAKLRAVYGDDVFAQATGRGPAR